MADAYFHAVTGNDTTGDGTAALPWKTLAKMATWFGVAGSSKTAHLAGTFSGSDADGVALTLLTSCTIQQWAGQTEAIIRGDQEISGTWTSQANNEWSISVTATSVERVFENWETRKDAKGANLGALSGPGSGVGALNENEFFDNSGTLYVRLFDNDDPNDFTMTFADSYDGLTLNACTNCVVRGIKFWCFCLRVANKQAAAIGAGIRLISPAGVTIDGCEFRDNGDGHICLTGAGTISGLYCQGCTFYGGSDQGGIFAMIPNGVNADDILFENFRCFAYPHLDRNGTVVTDISGLTGGVNYYPGFYVWNGGGANSYTNIVIRNGYFDGYGNADFLREQNHNVTPSDGDDFDTYPIRVSGVEGVNLRGILRAGTGSLGGPVAFKECSFDCPDMAEAAYPRYSIVNPATYGVLLQACVCTCDSGSTDPTGLYRTASSGIVRVINCLTVDVTSTAGSNKAMFGTANRADEAWKAVQSVFVFSSDNAIALTDAGTTAVDNLNFSNNWYYGYGSAKLTDNTDIDGVSEWQSEPVDADGIYGLDPGARVENNKGKAGGPMRAKVKRVSGAVARGVNGRHYSGHYGPFQYRRTRRDHRTRLR